MWSLYGRILKKKIETNIKEIKEQSGFRAGRSFMDNTFALQQIIKKRKFGNLSTYLVFMELEKACGSISLKKLFETLKTGISRTYIFKPYGMCMHS